MPHTKQARIRPAHETDAEDIARIIRDSYASFGATHIPADLPIYEAAFHLQAMNDPETRWVVACEGGYPVGVAMWRMVPGVAHLHMLFVAGAWQGRGHGVRLLHHHQTASLHEQRDTRIWTLHCLRDSAWAIRFYSHQGYTQYHPGDEWHEPDLVPWIDSCKSHDNGWPLRTAKVLFYRHVR